jgi:hypothetical protein
MEIEEPDSISSIKSMTMKLFKKLKKRRRYQFKKDDTNKTQ